MARVANKSAQRMDSFFAMQSSRSDLWRDALTAAQRWASGQDGRPALEESIANLNILEEFHAYPGVRLMGYST